MSWREIWPLYLTELRAALRERNVVINTVLLPLLLYPFLLWLVLNGLLLVQGRSEQVPSRIALSAAAVQRPGLLDRVADAESVAVLSEPPAAAAEAIRDGDIDAALEIEELPHSQAEFRAVAIYDSSREESALAGRRLLESVRRYRADWLRRRAESFVAPEEWEGFHIESRNLASERDMGAMVLGLVLPLYFVLMVSLGCLYPAVDTTAGEHERGTWETTLTLAVSRSSVAAAKYLYVTTMGLIAGVLNLAAMALSTVLLLAPLLAGEDMAVAVRVPWPMLPVLLLAALLLAGSVAAAMMTAALFARTFREGQALVAPVYLLTFLPVIFLGREGLHLSPALAAIPVVNVALLVREALGGSVPLLAGTVAVMAQIVLIALLLLAGARLLDHEEILAGTWSGSPLAFLLERLRGARP